MPPERDPAIAMQEEFALAQADDSSSALILFVARYPGTREAETARRLLAVRKAPDSTPLPGPDGAIIADFDAARRAGPTGLRAFIVRYPGHPLSVEGRQSVLDPRPVTAGPSDKSPAGSD